MDCWIPASSEFRTKEIMAALVLTALAEPSPDLRPRFVESELFWPEVAAKLASIKRYVERTTEKRTITLRRNRRELDGRIIVPCAWEACSSTYEVLCKRESFLAVGKDALANYGVE